MFHQDVEELTYQAVVIDLNDATGKATSGSAFEFSIPPILSFLERDATTFKSRSPSTDVVGKGEGGASTKASAESVDFSEKLVEVSQVGPDGKKRHFYVPYDKLVIGVGSRTRTHGVEGLQYCQFLEYRRNGKGKRGRASTEYRRIGKGRGEPSDRVPT
jgi:hypothetical protein